MQKAGVRCKVPIPGSGIAIKKSICAICDPSTQCGLDLFVRDGKIIKVEGSKENPYNKGTLCAKGAAIRQYVYHEDRIRTPLKRIGPRGSGKFTPISWDEALAEIAAKFNAIKREYGPESVAFFAGYTKYFRPYLQRLAHAFGSPNYMSESSTCSSAVRMAQKLVFGEISSPDIQNASCLLIWSRNPFYSNPVAAANIISAKERGLKIIVVDPRITPTTNHADIHLRLRPGTDGALALAMAHVIINEHLYDEEFVDKHTHGFKEYRDYVQRFTPEIGEELTGVPAEKIYAAARMYALAKPATVMFSAAPVVHHINGVQNQRAIFCLVGLTGNFDRLGGNMVIPPGFCHGGFPGFLTKGVEFAKPRQWDEMAPRIGQEKFPVWDLTVDEAQAMHLPIQILSERPYPVKALIGFGLNHRMWPDSDALLESFSKLDLFVNIDLFMTDSCKYADIVLPACTSVERSELRTYGNRYVVFTQPAIEPLYQSRSDVDIIYELAQLLGLEDPLFKAGYEASIDWILSPSGYTVSKLKADPAGTTVTEPLSIFPEKYLQHGFKTPSGKLEFSSSLLEQYRESHGYAGLPTYWPPGFNKETFIQYPYQLNTGSRLPMFIHSRTFRLAWTNSLRPDPAADINPVDADKLRILNGDVIKISTANGSIVVKANLTNIALPGVVHMYHGYPQANVNQLLACDYLDPISGFPGYKSLQCKIEKV